MGSNGVIYPQEVMRELKEIVAAIGPDTKRDCQYVEYENGELDRFSWYERDEAMEPVAPHCIVGTYLYRHGVPLKVLQGFEGETMDGISDTVLQDFNIVLDTKGREILREAQSLQDNGLPWGKALEHVDSLFFGNED